MIDEIKIKFLKSQLQKNGKLSVKINGECMVPFINENEIVMVKSVSKKISLGDVVMLYIDGNFKIHRIIKIDYTNRKVCTKGDNSVKVDSTKKLKKF